MKKVFLSFWVMFLPIIILVSNVRAEKEGEIIDVEYPEQVGYEEQYTINLTVKNTGTETLNDIYVREHFEWQNGVLGLFNEKKCYDLGSVAVGDTETFCCICNYISFDYDTTIYGRLSFGTKDSNGNTDFLDAVDIVITVGDGDENDNDDTGDADDDNDDDTCPLTSLLGQDDPRLHIIRQFRDKILAQSPTGRKLIKIYYQNEENIIAILEKHPAVRKTAQRVLEAAVPVMEMLLKG